MNGFNAGTFFDLESHLNYTCVVFRPGVIVVICKIVTIRLMGNSNSISNMLFQKWK